MIFKIAPTFMSGFYKFQNMFGFSQNDMKIAAKANNVRTFIIPRVKTRGYFKYLMHNMSYLIKQRIEIRQLLQFAESLIISLSSKYEGKILN